MGEPPTGRPASRGRVLRLLRRVLLAFFLLLLMAYAVLVGSGLVRSQSLKESARTQLNDSVPRALQSAAAFSAQVREAAGAPAHAWVAEECRLTSRDAGWIVETYEQRCAVDGVDAYAVGSLAEARRLAQRLAPLTGAGAEAAATERECAVLADRTVGDGPPATAVRTTVHFVPSHRTREYPCGVAPVDGPTTSGAERLHAGAHDRLPSDTAWVVVERSAGVGEHEVGCVQWSVLFCSPPPGVPVLSPVP